MSKPLITLANCPIMKRIANPRDSSRSTLPLPRGRGALAAPAAKRSSSFVWRGGTPGFRPRRPRASLRATLEARAGNFRTHANFCKPYRAGGQG
jgi:hypothetical protein